MRRQVEMLASHCGSVDEQVERSSELEVVVVGIDRMHPGLVALEELLAAVAHDRHLRQWRRLVDRSDGAGTVGDGQLQIVLFGAVALVPLTLPLGPAQQHYTVGAVFKILEIAIKLERSINLGGGGEIAVGDREALQALAVLIKAHAPEEAGACGCLAEEAVVHGYIADAHGGIVGHGRLDGETYRVAEEPVGKRVVDDDEVVGRRLNADDGTLVESISPQIDSAVGASFLQVERLEPEPSVAVAPESPVDVEESLSVVPVAHEGVHIDSGTLSGVEHGVALGQFAVHMAVPLIGGEGVAEDGLHMAVVAEA